MTQPTITHLLVLTDGGATANPLISGLRETGMALRATQATTQAELGQLLTQGAWDALACFLPDGDAGNVLALLAKHEQEIPVVLATRDEAMAQTALSQHRGLREAFAADQTARLVAAVRRAALARQIERRLQQLELRHAELEKRHRLVLEQSVTPIAYVQDGVHLYCNPAYAACFGYDSMAKIATTPFLNLLPAVERAAMKSLLSTPIEAERALTGRILRQDGGEAVMEFAFTPVEYEGRGCLQVTLRTPKGNADYAGTVAAIAGQDLLTRLDNRTRFLERLEAAIRKAVTESIFSSLLVIELNEFIDISTAIGKVNANIVLNDIAAFLSEVIRKPYAAARLEQHVFGILLHDGDPDAALALAAAIQGKINNRISPAMLSSLELSCSIGIALINDHAKDAAEALTRARNNLERKALAGVGKYEFQIGDNLEPDAGAMLRYLAVALAERRFKLLYQPLVNIKGENHQCYEVLLRMLDGQGNEVAPARFLPLATLNGMGESIDRLVVSMALDAPGRVAGQRLIINVTGDTLTSATFVPWLSDKLRQGRTSADSLILQLSEIDIHRDAARALTFCKGLRELGIDVAVSHFGCALDPFAVLDQARPALVKLDESLVRDVIYSSHQRAGVAKMISSLHARRLLVVVPQVEDVDALPVLWESGADYVQGYCLQAPSDEMNYEFVLVEEITLSASQS